ncbi:MAG TPA: ribonuclease P protein component [Actinomycetota bacterium]|nr:ribonuclease P protein component [Actinomycetota bacterium]
MPHPTSLSTSSDFRRVLAHGRRRDTAAGTVYVAPGPDAAGPARLGLIVSRRIGGAVARNRTKRRLRAAFRSAWTGIGHDVVIRAAPEARTLAFQELEKSLGGAA